MPRTRPIVQGATWWALHAETRGMMPQTTESVILGTPKSVRFPVEVALERRGFIAWTPTESSSRRKSRWAKARDTTTRALIPGLILVALPTDPREIDWYTLLETHYIRGWFGILRNLRPKAMLGFDAMEQRAADLPMDAWSLRKGNTAVVRHGNFEGQRIDILTVKHELSEPMARGLINFFGGEIEVEIPLDDLEGARE